MNDMYLQLFENSPTVPLINLGTLFKIPLVILLLATLFYAYMLLLKIRILVDTIDSSSNKKIQSLVTINFIVSVVGTVLGTVLILLG